MTKITKKPKSTLAVSTATEMTLTAPATKAPTIQAPATQAPAPRPALAPAPAPVAAVAKPQPVKSAAPAPKRNQVSLEILQPGVKTVCVAGSFNEWKPERTPLVQIGNGRWVGDLAVKPGRHEYLLVVDGQWLPDPNAKESVQNPFGGKNSVLIVSE